MKAGKTVVLIAEDDPKLLASIKEFLLREDYIVKEADSGQQALDRFFSSNQEIDIILLDVMLPEVDGFSVLRTIRKYSDVPIIMTTARESEEDQLEGLGSGADNYITKPFRLRVLAAHMEKLLQRRGSNIRRIVFDGVEIDVERREVMVDGERVDFT
ncbi:MAG: response regulator transcription factor, partial [Lachnospiraceae bacterium]|nr:response regulator transcription factor [Lachnospiraceae bacterium]